MSYQIEAPVYMLNNFGGYMAMAIAAALMVYLTFKIIL
jgi:hypothetical protein